MINFITDCIFIYNPPYAVPNNSTWLERQNFVDFESTNKQAVLDMIKCDKLHNRSYRHIQSAICST